MPPPVTSRTLALTRVDVAQHPLALRLRDHRPEDLLVAARIAVGQAFEHGPERLDCFLEPRAWHEHPGRDAATLARVIADGEPAVERLAEIGIVEQDVGGLAAQL